MATSAGATDPALQLERVTMTYGSRDARAPVFHALRDVSVRIPRGAFTTVAGPSGSGKSTLLAILGLLDQPTSGDVAVAGQHASSLGERARCRLRARQLGFVFQAFHLMPHRSVLDNVTVGGLYRGLSHQERRRQGAERLEQVGLGDRQGNLASTLSGGERQRTAMARALVGSPPILLCDEPTGNLDSTNGQAVVDLLRQLAGSGISVVTVTHEATIARLGEHQIEVVDGQVRGDGTG